MNVFKLQNFIVSTTIGFPKTFGLLKIIAKSIINLVFSFLGRNTLVKTVN